MTRTRREFLRDLAVSAPFIVSPGALAAVGRDQAAAPPWDRAAAILRRIVPPRFPSRHFEITRFGAVGDGRADCTSAIRRAIAACRAAGGGRVVVPRRPLPDRRHPARERRQSPPHAEGDAGVQPGRAALPAGRAHALGRHRADELLAVHLCVRGGEHRDHRHRHARRPGGRRATGGTGVATAARRQARSPRHD